MAYARLAIARSAAGFTVAGQSVTLFAVANFAAATAGSTTATHVGVGRASAGAGELLFFGTITPNITITNGVTPQLATSTNVAESAGDGMGNTSANSLLLLIFNNTDWANIGDAGGLRGSATAGSLYLSLHTASPGETGNQTTNEVSYV
jgi:hypothetical protein